MKNGEGHRRLGGVRLATALLLAAGLVAAGFLAGRGVIQARLQERSVTVKGVAEIEARADLATYPLRFTVTGADLAAAKATIDGQVADVTAFLEGHGFAPDEIALGRLEVQDSATYGYQPEAVTSQNRFTLAYTVTLRTTKVDAVAALAGGIGALVQKGIVLADTGGPFFVFTAAQLNAVKPELIRKATEAARLAADEFAGTSGARVGPIRRANQGVITVLARDESPTAAEYQSIDKRVRAVTTVEYFLVE
jgi:hypothetical protein